MIFGLPYLTKVNSIMADRKIVVLRLFLGLQDQKTLKRVKISKSIFRDFISSLNKIDHEESENRDTEMLVSILRALVL